MNRPIALFDSGIGGLTVLQEVIKILPNESYIYLADNAFFPYGTKSFEQLEVRLQKVVKYLISLGVKAIVIACNTASLHIESISKLAKIPVIDVILPTCNKVIQTTQNKNVCLLATNATVQSGKYQQVLSANGVDVVPIACSEFVPLAENGVQHTPRAFSIVQRKLQHYSSCPFDTVILGCTHFGLIKEQFSKILGNRKYVECGVPTAFKLSKVLQQNNLLFSGAQRSISVISTDSVANLYNFTHQLPFDFTNAKVVQIDL